jgi:N-methylhydantoinase A
VRERFEPGEADGVAFRRELEVLYTGQIHALAIPLPDGPFDDAAREVVLERFHAEHRRVYGHAEPDDPVSFLTARVFGDRPRERREVAPPEPIDVADAEPADVYFPGHGFLSTQVRSRDALRPGDELDGPALLTQIDTTTILPPGVRARVAARGELVVEVAP